MSRSLITQTHRCLL